MAESHQGLIARLELGRELLYFRQQVGIEAYLQNGVALRFTSQFCIDHFIGPGPKRALFLNATQNVRAAAPSADPESALCNNRYAPMHCIERLLDRIRINTNPVNARD